MSNASSTPPTSKASAPPSPSKSPSAPPSPARGGRAANLSGGDDGDDDPRLGLRRRIAAHGVISLGLGAIIVFFGGLGAWGWFARLDSAAIASGVVVSERKSRVVDHLEGGIIARLHVRDGDRVAPGEVLIELDAKQARAENDILQGRLYTLLAQRARLLAERDDAAAVVFPDELLDATTNDEVRQSVEGQERLFKTRKENLEGQVAVLSSRVDQAARLIDGLKSELASLDEQRRLIASERKDAEKLLAKGLEQRRRVLALQREAASLAGDSGRIKADIERTRQQISESELRVIALRNERQDEVSRDLRETEDELFSIRERLLATQDVVARLDIRAPIAGTVENMAVNTIGGVIAPGRPILEIVPADEGLIVEAQVRPEDIDSLSPGMAARVMLTAYDSRITPQIDGALRRLSADRMVDERTGLGYYVARVEVAAEALAAAPGVELLPGMPAEVIITTGERTPFDYFAQPIVQSFRHAFREP